MPETKKDGALIKASGSSAGGKVSQLAAAFSKDPKMTPVDSEMTDSSKRAASHSPVKEKLDELRKLCGQATSSDTNSGTTDPMSQLFRGHGDA